MSAKLQTKQVFTPGGQPTVTYIDRAHLGLESALKRAMARGFSIISVTGQTKSGKTVLCRKVVPEKARTTAAPDDLAGLVENADGGFFE